MNHPFFTVELSEFMVDLVCYVRMYTSGSISHLEELRDEMIEKYPPSWMAWLYKHAGELVTEENPNEIHMAGYHAYWTGARNPHDAGTDAAQAWNDGLCEAQAEAEWMEAD